MKMNKIQSARKGISIALVIVAIIEIPIVATVLFFIGSLIFVLLTSFPINIIFIALMILAMLKYKDFLKKRRIRRKQMLKEVGIRIIIIIVPVIISELLITMSCGVLMPVVKPILCACGLKDYAKDISIIKKTANVATKYSLKKLLKRE